MKEKKKRDVSIYVKFVYGSGEFFNATSMVLILMFFLKFLTDVVNISPALAGICIISGKLWDAISDPLFGRLSDRTESRFGRRRFYFITFAIPSSLAFILMWIYLPVNTAWVKIVYYGAAYIGFKTLSSLLNVPYQALGPELTSDYNERTSLIVFRMAFSIFGALMAAGFPIFIINYYKGSNIGHLIVTVTFSVIYVLIWLWVFIVVKERSQYKSVEKIPFMKSLQITLKNRAFRILIGIYLCSFLALDILTASAKYFYDEYIVKPNLMGIAMPVMLACALVALPIYFLLIKKYDRKRTYMIGSTIWTLALFALFTTGPKTDVMCISLIMSFIGFGVATAFIVPWSALPEVIDVDLAVNDRLEEGIYAGIMNFMRKFSTTIAIFLISIILEVFDYIPGASGGIVQPESAKMSIRIFSTIIPAIIIILGMAIASKYPISKSMHHLLRKRIDKKELQPGEKRELSDFLNNMYKK